MSFLCFGVGVGVGVGLAGVWPLMSKRYLVGKITVAVLRIRLLRFLPSAVVDFFSYGY